MNWNVLTIRSNWPGLCLHTNDYYYNVIFQNGKNGLFVVENVDNNGLFHIRFYINSNVSKMGIFEIALDIYWHLHIISLKANNDDPLPVDPPSCMHPPPPTDSFTPYHHNATVLSLQSWFWLISLEWQLLRQPFHSFLSSDNFWDSPRYQTNDVNIFPEM